MKKIISEGLIPVPPQMKKQAVDFVWYNILWWARDAARGNPLMTKFCTTVAKQRLGVSLPRERYKMPENKIVARSYPINMTGMPLQYLVMERAVEKWYIVVDWRTGGTVHGSFTPKHTALQICPFSWEWFSRWPNGDIGDLAIVLNNVQEVLDHEFRHLVQKVLLAARDPQQVAKSSDYKTDGQNKDSYYTSQVEFDPTIASSAYEMVQHYDLLLGYGKKPQLGKAIRKTVGMLPGDRFDGFRIDPFFVSLRQAGDMGRYRLAVKKFVVEVERLLAEKSLNG